MSLTLCWVISDLRFKDLRFRRLIIMTKEELIKRFKVWAVDVILFTRKFPNEPDFKAIRN